MVCVYTVFCCYSSLEKHPVAAISPSSTCSTAAYPWWAAWAPSVSFLISVFPIPHLWGQTSVDLANWCSVGLYMLCICWLLSLQIPRLFVQVFPLASSVHVQTLSIVVWLLSLTVGWCCTSCIVLCWKLSCPASDVLWWCVGVCGGKHQAFPRQLLELPSCYSYRALWRHRWHYIPSIFTRGILVPRIQIFQKDWKAILPMVQRAAISDELHSSEPSILLFLHFSAPRTDVSFPFCSCMPDS